MVLKHHMWNRYAVYFNEFFACISTQPSIQRHVFLSFSILRRFIEVKLKYHKLHIFEV